MWAPDIEIQKTVYAGTETGDTGCAGATELVYGESNAPVTYCFIVTNTGDTYLNTITIDDFDLGINETSPGMISYGGVSTPLAPNAS